jgi:hypothetical protein
MGARDRYNSSKKGVIVFDELPLDGDGGAPMGAEFS